MTEDKSITAPLIPHVREELMPQDPTEFTAVDAFGLLRSYSRHRDFVRLALTHVVQALERRAIEHVPTGGLVKK